MWECVAKEASTSRHGRQEAESEEPGITFKGMPPLNDFLWLACTFPEPPELASPCGDHNVSHNNVPLH